MKCPVCRLELIITGQDRVEDLGEHVCNPNGTPSMKDIYSCSNTSCPTIGICDWIYDGELLTRCGKYKEFNNIKFINDNNGPFGSFQRKCNVEVYGAGLKKQTKRLNLFNKIKLFFEYKYTSNEDGDVLSTKRKLCFVIRDGNDTWVYGTFPWTKISYIFRSFYSCLNRYKKNLDNQFVKKELYKDFYVGFSSDKRIIYRVCSFILRVIHSGIHNKLKKEFGGKLGYEL